MNNNVSMIQSPIPGYAYPPKDENRCTCGETSIVDSAVIGQETPPQSSRASGSDARAKGDMIDSILGEGISGGARDRTYRRIEKYPEGALRLMNDYGVKIVHKPLPFLGADGGKYFPQSKTVRIAAGANSDFFIRHPGISSFLGSHKPLAILAGLGVAFMSAIMFTTLPAAVMALGAGGLASAPLLLPVANIVRERSLKGHLEHELAHALDSALGASGEFKDKPVDSRVTFPYKTQNIPYSMKSSEVIDCYLACKEGKEGSSFVTEYAGSDPLEYFAESVKAFLTVDNSPESVHRSDLKMKDPRMFALLDNLFSNLS